MCQLHRGYMSEKKTIEDNPIYGMSMGQDSGIIEGRVVGSTLCSIIKSPNSISLVLQKNV